MASGWDALRRRLSHTGVGRNARPLAIVVGSGIHQEWRAKTPEQDQAKAILSSWSGLMREASRIAGLSSPPDLGSTTLNWEALVVRSIWADPQNSRAAREQEVHILTKLATRIEAAVGALNPTADPSKLRGLRAVLMSPAVTDVISLNLDLAVEALCDASRNRARGGDDLLRRHRVAERRDGSAVRIWHPHSDVKRPSEIALGFRRYNLVSRSLEEMRGLLKQGEREGLREDAARRASRDPETWVEIVMYRPLLFLGVGLDSQEQDIWKVMVDRWRNFAANRTAKYLEPAWKLWGKGDEPMGLPAELVQPLPAESWGEAWESLENIVREQ